MPLTRGRSVRFGGLLHRDSFEAGSFGSRPRLLCPDPRPSGAGGILGARAPVAQWIERWVPDPKVAGSSPVGRAISTFLGSASANPWAYADGVSLTDTIFLRVTTIWSSMAK